MKTMPAIIKFAAVGVATAVLLAGCYSIHTESYSFKGTAACENNPFLQRFDCSFSRIQSAAQAGNSDAQYALGYVYFYGVGTRRDTNAASVWIRRAAAQGQPLAIQARQILNSSRDPGMGAVDVRAYKASKRYKPANVEKLNTAVPAEPISRHLPRYSKRNSVKTQAAEPAQPSVEAKTPNGSGGSGHENPLDREAFDPNAQ